MDWKVEVNDKWQIQWTHELLQKPQKETEWKMCSASMEELATAVESLQGVDNYKEVVRHLLSLSVRSDQDSRLMVCHGHLVGVVLVQSDMGVQIASFRSKLVEVVCESLIRIVLVTGRDFQETENALLPHIITTAKNSSDAIRQAGAKLLKKYPRSCDMIWR
ncbi:hypothetical protein PsorP6_010456 [Peronosclerospora sorghi]|uniref:Uncharacterized protein n=1 Tax=Peronosclerospora sorghi TaxID=230839 RepID=A0ACC0VVC6_9STRA|nr:hypothetical protein PsorP6_010456 [Peronosclerospora sorghi]